MNAKTTYRFLYPETMFPFCRHEYKPAYWRSASPTYKRCSKCGDVKNGTQEEIEKWADESPWNKKVTQ